VRGVGSWGGGEGEKLGLGEGESRDFMVAEGRIELPTLGL